MFKRTFLNKISLFKVLLFTLLLALVCAGVVHAVLVNNKISGDLAAGSVNSYPAFQISPDGAYVVFAANALADDNYDLFSVPSLGGTRVHLSTVKPSGEDVIDFAIAPNSQTVVYLTGSAILNQMVGVYAVPIAGGTPVNLIESFALPVNASISDFKISSASQYLVFKVEYTHLDDYDILWAVPLDASRNPISLSPNPCQFCKLGDFQISPTAEAVFFKLNSKLNAYSPLRRMLYKADMLGDYTSMVDEGLKDFKITPNGNRVVFIMDTSSDMQELFSIQVDDDTPVRLSGDLDPGRKVIDFQIAHTSLFVVYRADELVSGRYELFSVPIDGNLTRRPIIDSFTDNPSAIIALNKLSPDDQWVVYLADLHTPGKFELHSVHLITGTTHRLTEHIADDGQIYSYQITPNSAGVIFSANYDGGSNIDLFAIPMTGPPLIHLNGDLPVGGIVDSFKITPNSQYVVYVADQEAFNVFSIYSVPSVGGTLPIRLNNPLVENGDLTDQFLITPNSKGVVYRADQDTDNIYELFITYDFQSPTDIKLSSTSVDENEPINTVVGTLSTTDPDTGDSFTYTLVPGFGDNSSFNISGNQLRTLMVFDFETKSSYSVQVRTTDLGGLTFDKTFTITVGDVFEEGTEGSSIFLPLVTR